MNNRIKELAIESGVISGEYNGFDPVYLPSSHRKFAELIIQECYNVVQSEPCCLEGIKRAIEESTINDCAWSILQHFGVEL